MTHDLGVYRDKSCLQYLYTAKKFELFICFQLYTVEIKLDVPVFPLFSKHVVMEQMSAESTKKKK